MKKKHSYFKNPTEDQQKFRTWVHQLEQLNGYVYDKFSIPTSLGTTQVYGLHTDNEELDTLVIFPGFRTTSLIWDLDKGLQPLAQKMRIFLIETNGQPNLSEGYSPSIKNLDYGKWGAEILEALGIESAFIAGASFGGLVCMKIALVVPEKIKSAFLLNPGCFRMVSLGLKNWYYNLLPLFSPTEANIQKFLDGVVFHKPQHQLSKEAEQLLIQYLFLAITSYKDKTEKPYYMKHQLDQIAVDTHLLVGENDILIPPQKSIKNAKKHLKNQLKTVKIFPNVGHGIECHPPCVTSMLKIIDSYTGN